MIPNVRLKFREMCVKILHKTSRIFPRYVILLDSMVKMKVKGSVLKFSYPMSLPVLCPCAICQLLSESLHLLAAAHFVTGPHFTLKPAGGRQVPPQHWEAIDHLTLSHRHWHVLPHVLLQEIWNGQTGKQHITDKVSTLHLVKTKRKQWDLQASHLC